MLFILLFIAIIGLKILDRNRNIVQVETKINLEALLGKTTTFELEFDELKRYYNVYIPTSYDISKSYPLIFVFHGGGGNPESAEKMTQFSQLAEQENIIVVYPAGTNRLFNTKLLSWNTGFCCGYAFEENINDLGFVMNVFKSLTTNFNIDQKRVFATGISNGGMMSNYVGANLSDVFKAVAPVSAQVGGRLLKFSDKISTVAENPPPMNIILINGLADEHIPYFGGKQSKGFPGTGLNIEVVSTEYSLNYWLKANDCEGIISKTTDLSDKVEERSFICSNGNKVILISIEGGNHSWPGGEKVTAAPGFDEPQNYFDATEYIWEFFKSL